jgi:mannose/fructose/N-acetylgalactosamine-specific phosphotransferase system component IIC
MIDFLLGPAVGQSGLGVMLTIVQNLGLAIIIMVMVKRYLFPMPRD